MEELGEKIVELIKEGYYLIEISKILNKNYAKSILPAKKKLMEQGFLTKEDIEKGKDERKRREWRTNLFIQQIFKYKMKGMTDTTISKMPDIDIEQSNVSKYIREGIRLGLIKKEDIEKAENERRQEEKLHNLDRKRVLVGLRRGELYTEIAKDTIVGYQQVKNIKLDLIEEGLITQKEIDEAREKARKDKQQEKENKLNEEEHVTIDIEKLLTYLILGYDTKDIKKKMQILNMDLYYEGINQLIEGGRITKKEIEEYRERKVREDKEKVLKGLKRGISQREIAKTIDSSLKKTQIYIKKIQKEENISDEDILRWKNEKETSVEKRKLAVLEGLKQGLSKSEIIKKYQKQQLKINDINNYRIILIKEGSITKEEIIKYRQLRRMEKNKDKLDLTDFEKQVWGYLRSGYEAREIAKLTKKSFSYTRTSIAKVKQKGKITDEEIKQARQQRKENEKIEQLREENRKVMKQLSQLKREINMEIKLDIQPSEEKKEKIREYIDLCCEIHKNTEISKSELLFLTQAFQKVPISYEDIVKYTQMCLAIKEYADALNMVRSRYERQQVTSSKEQEQTLQKLEDYLSKACKLEQAIEIIKRGNTNTGILSETTGLSRDEINILKIKLLKKPIRLLNISQREKVIELLLQDKMVSDIQRNLQISDFEMQDIEEQVGYRKIAVNKRDREAQIKQDSEIRIVVLATKLGIKPNYIAKILKKTSQEKVESNIKRATEVGLIKESDRNGIKLLNYSIPEVRQEEL